MGSGAQGELVQCVLLFQSCHSADDEKTVRPDCQCGFGGRAGWPGGSNQLCRFQTRDYWVYQIAAKEVGSRNITVNAVAPGFIKTALTDVLPKEMVEASISHTPLGRLGEVEDVAKAILFLASDQASFITGQILGVDGGLVMQ